MTVKIAPGHEANRVSEDLRERARGLNLRDAALVRRAQQALDDLVSGFDFPGYCRPYLQEARRLHGMMQQTPAHDTAACAELFEIAHNLKGLGSTFRYSLVTEVCTLLCKVLLCDQIGLNRRVALAQACLDTLELVLTRNLIGTGGQIGETLLRELAQTCQKLGVL